MDLTWLWIILAVILVFMIIHLFKLPKTGCISMTTGGVKTGKSMLSVWQAYRKFKAQRRKYYIKCGLVWICKKLFRAKKMQYPEKPYLYSNVKLAGVEYTLLTKEMILRNVRPTYGSVVYIQEASLFADSMHYKNAEHNERLLLFNKLFGHETRGGYLIYDTTDLGDNHYSVKRAISSYIWIHHGFNIPFFRILFVREMHYSDGDSNVVNAFTDDVEEGLKMVVIPKKVWKMYDAYCYSAFTDKLPVYYKPRYKRIPKLPFNRVNLKTRKIVTIKKFETIREYQDEE